MAPAGKTVTSVVGVDPRVDLHGPAKGNWRIARYLALPLLQRLMSTSGAS